MAVCDDFIEIILEDHGPGIADVELAMQEDIPQRLNRCALSASARGWGFRT